MALVRVAQYSSTPGPVTDYQAQNAHLQAFTNQLLTQQFILDAGTAQPVIKQGCYVSHGGSLYVADADTAITGSPSDGSVYIRVSGTTTLTVEFVTNISGYAWNPVYSALTSGSYTLLPYLIVKASTVWTRYNFNPNNQSFGDTRLNSLAVLNNATVGGTLGVTSVITGAKFIGPKVVEHGNESNIAQDFAGGELWLNYRGASSAITGLRIGNGIGDGGLIPVLCSSLGFTSLNPDNSTETSVQLSAGDSQVLAKGAYAMSLDASVVCQMKYGSDWLGIPGGFVISDGVNFRLHNYALETITNKIRKW